MLLSEACVAKCSLLDNTCKSILLAELRRCLSAATAAAADSPSDVASESSRPEVLGMSSTASWSAPRETETSASVVETELSDKEPTSDGRASLELGRELDDSERNRLFLSALGNMLL